MCHGTAIERQMTLGVGWGKCANLHSPGKLQSSCSAREEFKSASRPPGRGGLAWPRDAAATSPAWGVEGPEEELPRSTAAEVAVEEGVEAEGELGGWWEPPEGCGGSTRSLTTTKRREMEGPEPCSPSSACCRFLYSSRTSAYLHPAADRQTPTKGT